MTYRFDPTTGTIQVGAELDGPAGRIRLNLLLDTGANTTVIAAEAMAAAGFDASTPPATIPMMTASATGTAGLFIVPSFASLGIIRTNMPVLCHSLPSGINVDGLLGIDFLDEHILTLDFINHTVSRT